MLPPRLLFTESAVLPRIRHIRGLLCRACLRPSPAYPQPTSQITWKTFHGNTYIHDMIYWSGLVWCYGPNMYLRPRAKSPVAVIAYAMCSELHANEITDIFSYKSCCPTIYVECLENDGLSQIILQWLFFKVFFFLTKSYLAVECKKLWRFRIIIIMLNLNKQNIMKYLFSYNFRIQLIIPA